MNWHNTKFASDFFVYHLEQKCSMYSICAYIRSVYIIQHRTKKTNSVHTIKQHVQTHLARVVQWGKICLHIHYKARRYGSILLASYRRVNIVTISRLIRTGVIWRHMNILYDGLVLLDTFRCWILLCNMKRFFFLFWIRLVNITENNNTPLYVLYTLWS